MRSLEFSWMRCKSISFYTCRISLTVLLATLLSFPVFADDPPKPKVKPLKTKNIIIVVIDGVRSSEAWDSIPGNIPNMSGQLKRRGVYFSNFRNDGYTYTNSGHTAITTGINQEIDNYGSELPAKPSIFQEWLKQTGKSTTSAWIVSSKDKLYILGNTADSLWQNTFMPSLNCGNNGPGTGYRPDSLTLIEAQRVLATNRPNLMLINFMEPDGYAHAGNWPNYIRGITRDDRYVKQLYAFLQNDRYYKNNTTLLITTDHGRHLQSVDGGWVDHGDNCEGCRKIFLLAIGPDFKKGREVTTKHTLIDISATVAKMMGFEFKESQGQVMRELFSRKKLRDLNL